MAGKCQDKNQIFPEHTYVNIFDSGNLLNVKKNVIATSSMRKPFFFYNYKSMKQY